MAIERIEFDSQSKRQPELRHGAYDIPISGAEVPKGSSVHYTEEIPERQASFDSDGERLRERRGSGGD